MFIKINVHQDKITEKLSLWHASVTTVDVCYTISDWHVHLQQNSSTAKTAYRVASSPGSIVMWWGVVGFLMMTSVHISYSMFQLDNFV